MRATERSKPQGRNPTVRLFFRNPAQVLTLLAFAASAVVLCAQAVEIKLVNGRNGHAIPDSYVNVWLGKQRKPAIVIPTDKDGVASLVLTDKESEVNVPGLNDYSSHVTVNPIVKYDDDLQINVPFVLCQPRASDHSWLTTRHFSTKEVVRQGIVMPNICGKATASPQPGAIIIFVRPLTWWEKLKQ
jgi:hypothetical protein